jgi:hypothetical protein
MFFLRQKLPSFSIKTKTAVTVLEIGYADMDKRLPWEYRKSLREICLTK